MADPSMKPTGILTNSPSIAERLDRRCVCTGQSPHAQLWGSGQTAEAAKYTKEFCIAVLKGYRDQLAAHGFPTSTSPKLESDKEEDTAAAEAAMQDVAHGGAMPPGEQPAQGEALPGIHVPEWPAQEQPGQDADDAEEDMEEPSAEQKADIRRMHVNLGHPPTSRFFQSTSNRQGQDTNQKMDPPTLSLCSL